MIEYTSHNPGVALKPLEDVNEVLIAFSAPIAMFLETEEPLVFFGASQEA
jgi:hypothetical protein